MVLSPPIVELENGVKFKSALASVSICRDVLCLLLAPSPRTEILVGGLIRLAARFQVEVGSMLVEIDFSNLSSGPKGHEGMQRLTNQSW